MDPRAKTKGCVRFCASSWLLGKTKDIFTPEELQGIHDRGVVLLE